MQYMGGKTRIAKHLAATIHECVPEADQFWDAFCGGLSMSVALSTYGRVISSDANEALISLYAAVRAGWAPPERVDRWSYTLARLLPNTDPRKAFCGFGCSFGGKWFGGYAAGLNGVLTYPQLAARNVRRAAPVPAEIAALDFMSVTPKAIDAVIYCDPPYQGTTGYAAIGSFNHDRFVRRVREWSAFAHVFVSEYSFPLGRVVWERADTTTLARGAKTRRAVERLFWIERRAA